MRAWAAFPRTRDAGFSLVELVAALAVLGVLAAFAVPRMVGTSAFQSRGFYDQAQGIVRYAQKVAIAQRQSSPKPPIFVVIATTGIRACYDAACSVPVIDPVSGAAIELNAPAGVTLAPPTTFSFTGSGAPSIASQLAVIVASTDPADVSRTFFVEAQTGYVHD